MREVRQRRKEALITELEEGEIRDGRVVSLENFGAFVDIGGAEGLVHITELSWKHVTHPRQVLDVGQEVRVKVISVDENRNRIGLSIKQLKADPWDEIAAELRTGSLIRATVTKLTKFGAFARVESKQAVEGLIHISELDDSRVEHPRDVVSKGDKLTLRVVKVDVKNRRLGLSLRRVNSPEFLDEDLKRAYEEQEARVDEEPDDEPDTEEAEAADDDTDDTPEEVVAEGTGSEEVEDEVEDAIEKADEDEADDDDDDDESDDDEPDNDDDDDDDDDNDESDDDESDEDDD
jgi:small subunit ribosomal protein S1